MHVSSSIEAIRAKAATNPLAYLPSPASRYYQKYLTVFADVADRHITLCMMNRPIATCNLDQLAPRLIGMPAADRAAVLTGEDYRIQEIADSAERLANVQAQHSEVLATASEMQMSLIGNSMRGRFVETGEAAIEAFEVYRNWREYLDHDQSDLLPLFDSETIGRGPSFSLFARCFGAWAEAALPFVQFDEVRRDVLNFIADRDPEIVPQHIASCGARGSGVSAAVYSPTSHAEMEPAF